jgi:choline dehydrogenase-like flavoprotein
MYCAEVTSAAAERLGLHPYPAPTGCNSVPYDDRPACNNCGFCAFFGCPIHAKGDPVGLLRRALTSGRAELRPNSFVNRVLVANGRATGVEWIDSAGDTHVETADHVILAAGAMETPRLLLLSGIDHPAIGRHLMFHFQTLTFGQLPMRLHAHKGRDVTHVHDDFIIVDADARAAAAAAGLPWLKGGLVEHGGASHPMMEAKLYPWGPDHKKMMRESLMREHMVGFTMQGEDLPQATNRIDLDPSIRDIHGLPVARTTYQPHRHELAASAYYAPKLEAILAEAGALWSGTTTSPRAGGGLFEGLWHMGNIPVSRHVMGTVRMGTDPATSGCDEWARLHDVPNVVICDSSVFPTATGYGPTLTLVALSIRNSRALTT